MINELINQPGVIAITGGSGFIGKHLIAALSKSDGPEIRVLSRKQTISLPQVGDFKAVIGDLADKNALEALVSPGCTVINLAYSYSNTMAQNIVCATNLAEVCARSNVKRVIHCSTASVFGEVNRRFLDEAEPCNPRSEYGINKYEIEEIFRKHSKFGYQLYTLRPTSVLGVGGLTLNKMINEIRYDGFIKRYLRESVYGARQLNLLGISVLVNAIIFLVEADGVNFGEYIVSQDYAQENNYAFMSDLVYSILGKRKVMPRIRFPWKLLELLLWLKGRHVDDPQRRFSWTKLENAGFRHDRNFVAMLEEYVSTYLLVDRRFPSVLP
jgi:nucleoside-diphosphate-sugar epimerase